MNLEPSVTADRVLARTRPERSAIASQSQFMHKTFGFAVCSVADAHHLIDRQGYPKSEGEDLKDLDDHPTVACPTCSGPLSPEGQNWVCAVGHRFDMARLADDQSEAIIRTLWYSLRALEDRGIVSKFIAANHDEHGRTQEADAVRSRGAEDFAVSEKVFELIQHIRGIDLDTVLNDETSRSDDHSTTGSHG